MYHVDKIIVTFSIKFYGCTYRIYPAPFQNDMISQINFYHNIRKFKTNHQYNLLIIVFYCSLFLCTSFKYDLLHLTMRPCHYNKKCLSFGILLRASAFHFPYKPHILHIFFCLQLTSPCLRSKQFTFKNINN